MFHILVRGYEQVKGFGGKIFEGGSKPSNELFCGGAALYFLRPVPAPAEILNDVNGELINLYRSA